MLNIRHENPELEKRLKHFVIDHPEDYPTVTAFIVEAALEKLEKEEKKSAKS